MLVMTDKNEQILRNWYYLLDAVFSTEYKIVNLQSTREKETSICIFIEPYHVCLYILQPLSLESNLATIATR